jgi:transcriptional regulator with XRE-family HTH domain
MNFGERIRDLRKARQLTQREFAEKLGIDYTYVSKIENGKNDHPPSEAVIVLMAHLLDVDSEELLNLAGQFNHQELHKVIEEMPEAAVLLRKLQTRQFTRADIQRFLRETQEPGDAT